MSLNNLGPGKNPPEHFNVVIEIPANSTPVKYEVDKATGLLTVDRFLGTAMHYPANYGYVPKTLAGDGDPVDVLVITPFPLVQLRAQIQHFFEHYKDLEKGKWVKLLGWGDAADAKKEIMDGIANYKE